MKNQNITKNANNIFNIDSLNPETELFNGKDKTDAQFLQELFENVINPPFKVFLKRIIFNIYPNSRFFANEQDIYDDTNDDVYKELILESAKTHGVDKKDYLFDNKSYTLQSSINFAFGGGKRTGTDEPKRVSRDQVLIIAFALGLNVAQANELLTKGLREKTFNMRNPFEVAACWCLNLDETLKYEKYVELKSYIKNLESKEIQTKPTDFYRKKLNHIETMDEIKNLLETLTGWGLNKNGKVTITSSQTAKNHFINLSKEINNEILRIESDIDAGSILTELGRLDGKITEYKNRYNDETDKSKRYNLKKSLMEYKEMYKKLDSVVDLESIVNHEISAEEIAKRLSGVKWLNELDDTGLRVNNELLGENYLEDIKNKKFRILNENPLMRNIYDDLISGEREVVRDHILVLCFYRYVLKTYNDYYFNLKKISDEDSGDDYFVGEHYAESWADALAFKNIKTRKLLFDDFKNSVDEWLTAAHFNEYYMPNAMDSFIFMCLISSNPISTFKEIMNA